jgi:hypothetical protein
MKRQSADIDWLGMEQEIREILRDEQFPPEDALKCIDEILARYTLRGAEIRGISQEDYDRLSNQHPKYFDWSHFPED